MHHPIRVVAATGVTNPCWWIIDHPSRRMDCISRGKANYGGSKNAMAETRETSSHVHVDIRGARRKLDECWRCLRNGSPGSRFLWLHEQRQVRQDREASAAWMLGGLILVCVGLILLVAPGPGLLVIAAGVFLLARESRQAARSFDRCEVHCRLALNRFRRLYRSWQ